MAQVCADPAAKAQLQHWMWGCVPPRMRATMDPIEAALDAGQASEPGQRQGQEHGQESADEKEEDAQGAQNEEGRGGGEEEGRVQRSQRGRLLSPTPLWGFGTGRSPRKPTRLKAGLGLGAPRGMRGPVIGSQDSGLSLSQSCASDSFIDDGEEGSEDMWSGGEEEGRGRGNKRRAQKGLAQRVLLLVGPPGVSHQSQVTSYKRQAGIRKLQVSRAILQSFGTKGQGRHWLLQWLSRLLHTPLQV